MKNDNKNRLEIAFKVNGKKHKLYTYPMMRLLDVLRDELKLTGTKEGCGEGECGACYVLLDNKVVNSCLVPIIQVSGHEVMTIEGLQNKPIIKKLSKTFWELNAAQCGICTPGMIVASYSLLTTKKKITSALIKETLGGNLCRCTGYSKITEAVIKTIKKAGKK